MEHSKCKCSPDTSIMVVTDKLQGLTTAAQKINRRGILAKYQMEVDKLYADGN